MYRLIIASGKHKGRRIELPDRQVLIGRDESCLIRMTSLEVSRIHCSLTPTAQGLLVRDCNSQNGTIVNHRRIDEELIVQPGDRLQVGPVSFQIEGPPAEESGGNVEDSVLSWLADGESSVSASTGDTTVVKVPPQLQQPPPEHRPPRFRSVAEEAQDILREWRELQQHGTSPQ